MAKRNRTKDLSWRYVPSKGVAVGRRPQSLRAELPGPLSCYPARMALILSTLSGLASEGLKYALTGEASFNLLNLDMFGVENLKVSTPVSKFCLSMRRLEKMPCEQQ